MRHIKVELQFRLVNGGNTAGNFALRCSTEGRMRAVGVGG